MAFTYNYGANPPIDYPRLLIADTKDIGHVFEDSEIMAATTIVTLQYQSGMYWAGPQGANLPQNPVSYLRIAACLLDCLASNYARLANNLKVLDITMNVQAAAQELQKQAKAFRDTDDNAGAFMIIEQCNNDWSFADRWWKTWARFSAQ
jgi:hypothetical protein